MRRAMAGVALCALCVACGSAQVVEPDVDPRQAFDAAACQRVDSEMLVEDLLRARAIVVGERHHIAADHAAQSWILDRVCGAGPCALGLEMVERSRQPVLDAYARGELTLDALPKALDWGRTWGFDWKLYRPLFAVARDRGAALVALNLPRAAVRALGSKGIEALGPDERAVLPPLGSGSEAHRRYVRRAFDQHPHAGHKAGAKPQTEAETERAFERFYLAQLAWDEAMAASAASFLAMPEAADRRLVLAIGRGHAEHGLGVPLRLGHALGSMEAVRVVLPLDRSAGEFVRERGRECGGIMPARRTDWWIAL